jgi:tetratricopeptide (TPR) repeat protein
LVFGLQQGPDRYSFFPLLKMKPLPRYLFLLAFFVFPLGAQLQTTQPDLTREALKHCPANTNRVKLLLDLSYYYVRKLGERAQDLDSALLLARQAVVLSQSLGFRQGEGRGHLMLAKALREKGALHIAKGQAERAMDLAQQHGYLDLAGHVYSELTRYYSNAGPDIATKIRLNEHALAIFVRAGDRKKEADVLKDQADLHQLQENYHRSLRELHRALALYRSVQYPNVQGVYDLLGLYLPRRVTTDRDWPTAWRPNGPPGSGGIPVWACAPSTTGLGLPTTRWDSWARRSIILKSRSR